MNQLRSPPFISKNHDIVRSHNLNPANEFMGRELSTQTTSRTVSKGLAASVIFRLSSALFLHWFVSSSASHNIKHPQLVSTFSRLHPFLETLPSLHWLRLSRLELSRARNRLDERLGGSDTGVSFGRTWLLCPILGGNPDIRQLETYRVSSPLLGMKSITNIGKSFVHGRTVFAGERVD
jgi:hypothetical protein